MEKVEKITIKPWDDIKYLPVNQKDLPSVATCAELRYKLHKKVSWYDNNSFYGKAWNSVIWDPAFSIGILRIKIIDEISRHYYEWVKDLDSVKIQALISWLTNDIWAELHYDFDYDKRIYDL